MRLIGLKRTGDNAIIQFYGCPLRCQYCTHVKQPKREFEMEEVLEFVSDPKISEIYVGGAEPTLQRKQLIELLQRLKRMNKRVILKTSGYDPDFLVETKGLVKKYVVEIKCPLDDLLCTIQLTNLPEDRAQKYLEALKRSLEVLRGENVRIWIRVVPGYVTKEAVERIGKQIAGIASEVLLYQFLSNPENDAPFAGIEEPSPSESEIIEMARVMLEYVPKVIVRGKGFANEFMAERD
ncbi:MAG: radical SAM protein [Methanomassiliicoccales archaeon]|jgi:pyruvate formate lyase activating enzyme|nr:radical SAM protein [Methanomassiliicoccales archaeon]